MSIRIVHFADGEFYHIYNRGNSKQKIFHNEQDYFYFIDLLVSMNTEKRTNTRDAKTKKSENDDSIISIGAYCLMPNHFHILIKQEKENGISKFMQKLLTAYVMYYNKKYKHTGSLFEGKFKSKYAGEDTYLKYLFSYIHLNPLKIFDESWKSKTQSLPQEKLSFLSGYKYSSFNEYLSERFVVVNKKSFPDYFPTKESFLRNIIKWFIDDFK